jgi:hypothetical protein
MKKKSQRQIFFPPFTLPQRCALTYGCFIFADRRRGNYLVSRSAIHLKDPSFAKRHRERQRQHPKVLIQTSAERPLPKIFSKSWARLFSLAFGFFTEGEKPVPSASSPKVRSRSRRGLVSIQSALPKPKGIRGGHSSRKKYTK